MHCTFLTVDQEIIYAMGIIVASSHCLVCGRRGAYFYQMGGGMSAEGMERKRECYIFISRIGREGCEGGSQTKEWIKEEACRRDGRCEVGQKSGAKEETLLIFYVFREHEKFIAQ